ncbi:Ppx/GppA phosphatase family protein [Janibacter cremeus]|uniref:Exopolyphosphatase/guanosine-5'-triphosphate, 3'-diphosphate pyrophosphatase n=1 Tax=Janibacter cremeus TaxID=1285192 RepID=A0A852VZI9_9MICO|nr:exopolyphosphatase/guanosine-5'-triphosphate,3'-diphosphate pyrophosphatase [Janibacter cremeus]
MRLGVIDIGSNTVHLLVVDAHHGAAPIPATKHKMVLRLAEHVDAEGAIDESGAADLARFVHECLGIAEDQGVEEILAFATSAIREAPNGDAVLERVRSETGVDLQVLQGTDEARLTFLAARRWVGWSAGRLLVIDIGGGSLELTLGDDEEPDVAKSLLLGAGRVTQDHLPGDPPSAEDIRAARRTVRASLAREIRPYAKAATPDSVVGTSKTVRSLARIAGAAPSGEGPYVLRTLHVDDVRETIARVAAMTAAQRAGLAGVSAARARQILAGGIIAEASMDLLGVQELSICPWAMREGVLLRYLDLMG